MIKTMKWVLVLITCSILTYAHADEGLQIGRYSTQQPGANLDQIDPLQTVITVTIPNTVNSVSAAFNYLLQQSGYTLTNGDPMLPVLFNAQLPSVHRELGPITLEQALTTLAGPAWILILDPVNRMLSFELRSGYRSPPHFTADSGRYADSNLTVDTP